MCERCGRDLPTKHVQLTVYRVPLLALDLCQQCIDVIAGVMSSRQSFSEENVDG